MLHTERQFCLSRLCWSTEKLGLQYMTTLLSSIFDNADFNTRTLDGKDSFHCMGGLRCVIPSQSLSCGLSTKCLAMLQNQEYVRQIVSAFNNPSSSPHEVASADEQFFLSLYGASHDIETLDEHRYFMYNSLVAKQGINKDFDLAVLPPTSAAARQLSYRVFHQIQQWVESPCHKLNGDGNWTVTAICFQQRHLSLLHPNQF